MLLKIKSSPINPVSGDDTSFVICEPIAYTVVFKLPSDTDGDDTTGVIEPYVLIYAKFESDQALDNIAVLYGMDTVAYEVTLPLNRTKPSLFILPLIDIPPTSPPFPSATPERVSVKMRGFCAVVG